MKKLLWILLGLAAFSWHTLRADQKTNLNLGLPTPTASPETATDMYHYTDADEVELQSAKADYNLIQGEYQNFSSQYRVISFKALDSGSNGCRIQMDGGTDCFLHGYKALSDQYYADVAVKITGDYTYSTVNNSDRTIPSYTVASAEELEAIVKKRNETGQAMAKYNKLAKTKATKIANERALNANIESAERGEGYGLRRMSERYAKGDGVEKDPEKATELLKMAEAAEQSDENRLLIAKQMTEEFGAKQMFQNALKSADNGDYASAVKVARFYRDGKGTDKDPNKALEYFEKAQVLKHNADYSAIPDTIQSEIDEIRKQVKPGSQSPQ
jgi:hypothetical protein